jgi:hypothetical protein
VCVCVCVCVCARVCAYLWMKYRNWFKVIKHPGFKKSFVLELWFSQSFVVSGTGCSVSASYWEGSYIVTHFGRVPFESWPDYRLSSLGHVAVVVVRTIRGCPGPWRGREETEEGRKKKWGTQGRWKVEKAKDKYDDDDDDDDGDDDDDVAVRTFFHLCSSLVSAVIYSSVHQTASS